MEPFDRTAAALPPSAHRSSNSGGGSTGVARQHRHGTAPTNSSSSSSSSARLLLRTNPLSDSGRAQADGCPTPPLLPLSMTSSSPNVLLAAYTDRNTIHSSEHYYSYATGYNSARPQTFGGAPSSVPMRSARVGGAATTPSSLWSQPRYAGGNSRSDSGNPHDGVTIHHQHHSNSVYSSGGSGGMEVGQLSFSSALARPLPDITKASLAISSSRDGGSEAWLPPHQPEMDIKQCPGPMPNNTPTNLTAASGYTGHAKTINGPTCAHANGIANGGGCSSGIPAAHAKPSSRAVAPVDFQSLSAALRSGKGTARHTALTSSPGRAAENNPPPSAGSTVNSGTGTPRPRNSSPPARLMQVGSPSTSVGGYDVRGSDSMPGPPALRVMRAAPQPRPSPAPAAAPASGSSPRPSVERGPGRRQRPRGGSRSASGKRACRAQTGDSARGTKRQRKQTASVAKGRASSQAPPQPSRADGAASNARGTSAANTTTSTVTATTTTASARSAPTGTASAHRLGSLSSGYDTAEKTVGPSVSAEDAPPVPHRRSGCSKANTRIRSERRATMESLSDSTLTHTSVTDVCVDGADSSELEGESGQLSAAPAPPPPTPATARHHRHRYRQRPRSPNGREDTAPRCDGAEVAAIHTAPPPPDTTSDATLTAAAGASQLSLSPRFFEQPPQRTTLSTSRRGGSTCEGGGGAASGSSLAHARSLSGCHTPSSVSTHLTLGASIRRGSEGSSVPPSLMALATAPAPSPRKAHAGSSSPTRTMSATNPAGSRTASVPPPSLFEATPTSLARSRSVSLRSLDASGRRLAALAELDALEASLTGRGDQPTAAPTPRPLGPSAERPSGPDRNTSGGGGHASRSGNGNAGGVHSPAFDHRGHSTAAAPTSSGASGSSKTPRSVSVGAARHGTPAGQRSHASPAAQRTPQGNRRPHATSSAPSAVSSGGNGDGDRFSGSGDITNGFSSSTPILAASAGRLSAVLTGGFLPSSPPQTTSAENTQRAKEQRRREFYAWNELSRKRAEGDENAV